MSAPENSNSRPDAPVLEGGVLAALPRTRPQRASARRAAARGKAAKSETAPAANAPVRTGRAKAATKPPAEAKPTAKIKPTVKTKPAAKTRPKPQVPAKAATPAKRARVGHGKRQPQPPRPAEPPAPKQGYEAEEELELGNTVNPPSGVELLESIGEIVGELAGSSLTAGGRLLKDAFSILRRP